MTHEHDHDHDVTDQGTTTGEAGQPEPMTRATEHYRDDKVAHAGDDHTWGAAVTSLIGPTDETIDAVDPHEAVSEERRSVEGLLQEAVTAVRATHGGTHSREVVRDALQRELEHRGRWPQPEPWLDAVATEIEADGAYTVSTTTVPAGEEPPATLAD